MLLGAGNVWADQKTVYYAISSEDVGSYTLKFHVNRAGDSDQWDDDATVSKQTYTYAGLDVYACTYTDLYGGVGKMQFQLWDGSDWKSEDEVIGSWTTDVHTGEMYIHNHGWFNDVYYIRGAWDSWSGHAMSAGTYSVYLADHTTYAFELNTKSSAGYKWSKDITYLTDASNQVLSYGQSYNCQITTNCAGLYTFTVASETADGTKHPKISVAYPTGAYEYTVAYTNPSNWLNVYAYVYDETDGKKEQLGGFPGVELSAPYSLKIKTGDEITKIIFSNGSSGTGNQSYTLDMVDGNVYHYSGVVEIGITDDGYATFYAPCKVQVPAEVTAFTGTYNNAGELTLKTLKNHPNVISSTPVVLKRTSGSGNISLTAVTSDQGEIDGSNSLLGTAYDLTTPANSYVLGYNNSTTAFFHFTGSTIPANKAYLIITNYPEAAPGIRIIEEGSGATNIDAADAVEEGVKFIKNGQLFIQKNGVVYDVTGCAVK